MYNKKILERFRNPKHMGEIKDADGVGIAGNPICGDQMQVFIQVKNDKIKDIKFQTFGCLPPNEKVSINEGDWIDAVSVKVGDVVLDGNGNKTTVVENYVREHNGQILTIIPFISKFNKFSITPEHPVLCVKRKWLKSARKSSGKCNWLRIKESELLSTKPDFVEAKDLEVSDYLIYSPNKKVEDSSVFTENIMKLLGYYLAEGYPSAKDSVLNFALGEKEEKYINEIKELLQLVTGKIAKQRTRNGATEIRICSRKWVKFFLKYSGKYARHKKLSDEILTLPFEKQWKMIETYVNGDGNLYKRRDTDSFTYRITTASIDLAIQIQEILARGKIFSAIKEDIREDRIKNGHIIQGRRVNVNPYYEIAFKLERKHKFFHINGDHFLIPIKKIESEQYTGKVYNFQVAEPHTYLVKGFVVHNCPAAIAASDALCELAKGKTLKQAEKIAAKDIVKLLGSMPTIKTHCSVLGMKTLKNAITDYRKKH